MNETKKWYESKGIWGAIVAIVATLATAYGYNIKGQETNIVELIMQIVAALGGLIAVYGRAKAKSEIKK